MKRQHPHKRMKVGGREGLKFFCQMCEKQCRDVNKKKIKKKRKKVLVIIVHQGHI
jgi:hypothetical protein